jgi:D-alanyl-D-alanine carboxypeptidase/D-alanyl-D-alanine-endopeptidase (penicillin-binding protein 4)
MTLRDTGPRSRARLRRRLVSALALAACGGLHRAASGSRPPAPGAVPGSLAALSGPLSGWLRTAGLGPEQLGLVIWPLEAASPAFEHNGGRAFNPASAMKLLTSYAGLSVLGPDYRWRTSAFLRGQMRGDVLQGDLVLRGGGDPKLVAEDLAQFVGRMRSEGLRELRGDLVIDDSLFAPIDESAAPFDGDPSQPYNVLPHPLLMNFKSARLLVQPGRERAEIGFDPPLADLRIDNQVRLLPGPCRHGVAGLLVRDAPPTPAGSAGVSVSGGYSAACGEQGLFTALLSHRRFIHGFFKAAWESAGGVFLGDTRAERGAGRGQPWLEWVSPRTLADVVRDINKFSNNVMSRNLLLQLAAEPGRGPSAEPASVERARRVLERWLESIGLRFPELVLENGAGLSRIERLAPLSLAALLRHAAGSPVAEVFRQSLSVVGRDGTMRHRLVGEPMAGQAWVKTGSLNDVRSLAGYVDAASGRRQVVVAIVNGPRADMAPALLDQLLRWVHAQG